MLGMVLGLAATSVAVEPPRRTPTSTERRTDDATRGVGAETPPPPVHDALEALRHLRDHQGRDALDPAATARERQPEQTK